MNYRKTLMAASIVTGLCMGATAFAQDSTPTQDGQATTPTDTPTTAQQRQAERKRATELGTVMVTGIRGSEAEALSLKRADPSHVEVVTSEDIGKLPAKNVADTLQRLPGVNISSATAAEGGFDESDRVSLRGTTPSLTQTLINGHTVGTGDWFVLSQTKTVGRSVSFSMLPAEIVSQVVVHKSSEASIQEGGAAGSVDIITRRPLEFAKPITAEATVGGVYADLPGDTKPQFSGLFNYKNDANTFGVLLQGFYEKRSLRRDGQEYASAYGQFTPGGVAATAHPDLAGVYYPGLLGATLFEQTRERKGGVIDIQFKPTDNVTLGLNGFYSKLNANNFNRNYLLWGSHFADGQAPEPGYTVQNGVLTHAVYAPVAGTNYGVYDQISRPDASSSSAYLTLDGEWKVTDTLVFKAQAGTTKGTGKSKTQDVMEVNVAPGSGASWQQNGFGRPTDFNFGTSSAQSPASSMATANWIFGAQDIDAKDKEDWGQIDGELDFDGTLSSLQFGVRYASHTRQNMTQVGQGPLAGFDNPANWPTSFSNYPGDFGDGLGGSFPNNVWFWSQGDLAAFNDKFTNRDPVTRNDWSGIYKVNEKDGAAYLQANFSGDRWSGNVGVRYVNTKELINYASSAFDSTATTSSGPITTSAFGPYYWNAYKHSYGKLLPSANLKFDLTDDVVARFAASQTMTRPDYSALAGATSREDLGHTGSGGNTQLKPLISTNFDTALEWYFAPRGLLSVGAYLMDLNDYVGFGKVTRVYKDMQASTAAGHDVFVPYVLSVPANMDGSIKGVELNYIQPIGDNFGIAANYTYADQSSGTVLPLMGTSKSTANLSGFFENARFNARLSYTYRSEFYVGVNNATDVFQIGSGNLAASLGYTINDWMSVSVDAMNLNNPTLKYYGRLDNGAKVPFAYYNNGRQYYVNLRFKF